MEEPLNIERNVVKNGVRLDCVFEGYEYRPEREEVRSQRLAGFECVEIAENTGLSLEQVTDYCRELGLPETGSCQLQPSDGSRERHCPVCGRILVQRGNSGRRRFCSPECREEYYRQHKSFRIAVCITLLCGSPAFAPIGTCGAEMRGEPCCFAIGGNAAIIIVEIPAASTALFTITVERWQVPQPPVAIAISTPCSFSSLATAGPTSSWNF